MLQENICLTLLPKNAHGITQRPTLRGESNGKSQLANFFSKFLRIRELWRVERGGGLKFHENKKCFKK